MCFHPEKFSDFITEVLTHTDAKEIARKCEVAVSTVDRWARGSSVPGIHTQMFVRDMLTSYTSK